MNMDTINVRLPHEQVTLMDKLISKHNYVSRSEFVRDALRRVSEQWMDLSDETVDAINEARRNRKTIPHAELKKKLGF